MSAINDIIHCLRWFNSSDESEVLLKINHLLIYTILMFHGQMQLASEPSLLLCLSLIAFEVRERNP